MEKKNARKIGNFSRKMLTTTAWRMRTYLKVKVRHAVSVAHMLLVMAEDDAAERILSSTFSTSQESSLEDYVQVSVTLQYNHRH